jgi:4'-phosphopantetheinyl transferase
VEHRAVKSVNNPMSALKSLSIDAGQIHLWCVDYASSSCQTLLEQYRHLLSNDERDRGERFRYPHDRLRYLLTRILTRCVLSGYTGISPEFLLFSCNPYGKPDIANELSKRAGISFNVSHTPNLIVLAVSNNGALGIDVENFRFRRAPLEIANNTFSSDEATELRSLIGEGRNIRFFQYWTLKESYIKARGMGLSIPLDLFSFAFAGDRINLHLKSKLCDSASHWKFWQLKLKDDYLISVCSQQEMFKQELVVRSIVPLSQDGVLAHRIICESF